MKLIADSGASKTDWVWIYGKNQERFFQSQGLNPFYIDTAGISEVIDKEIVPFIHSEEIKEIYFYGAGCSSVSNKVIVEDAIEACFPDADIYVQSDLLGAARALLGNSGGIACILGTGSNSCYFDGAEIADNIPSLGYFFGDEGSGAHLGKQLCTAFMLERLPSELRNAFIEKYGITRENILHSVYRLPFPNKYLAFFSFFLHENISHPFVFELVAGSFRNFFLNTVSSYADYQSLPVHFTGSVAYFFQDILRSVAASENVNIHSIQKSPLPGMIAFHA
ncbi:MAG: ATPase [Bacteroidales bacterium]|nr:ATPase [Bacteroidales bacterium]